MHVTLVTLSGVQFNDEANEVRLRTPNGAMVVLPHHESLTAITDPGPVTIIDDEAQEIIFASFGGLIEVTNNSVRILVDEAEFARDLVESEIQDALKAAQALKEKARDQKELDEAQKLIDRQAVRLEVSRIRRKPRG